ncbi:MAG: hypothetical protein ACFCVD_17450 [Nodosilinea sp.]
MLWTDTVRFDEAPAPDRYRLLIREYEMISAEYTANADGTTNPALSSDLTTETRILGLAPRRLVYAETIAVDAALVAPAPPENRRTRLGETL